MSLFKNKKQNNSVKQPSTTTNDSVAEPVKQDGILPLEPKEEPKNYDEMLTNKIATLEKTIDKVQADLNYLYGALNATKEALNEFNKGGK